MLAYTGAYLLLLILSSVSMISLSSPKAIQFRLSFFVFAFQLGLGLISIVVKGVKPTYVTREHHAYSANNSWNVTFLSHFFK